MTGRQRHRPAGRPRLLVLGAAALVGAMSPVSLVFRYLVGRGAVQPNLLFAGAHSVFAAAVLGAASLCMVVHWRQAAAGRAARVGAPK